MLNSETQPHQQLQSQSARSQNSHADIKMIDTGNQIPSKYLCEQEHIQTEKISVQTHYHSSFVKSVCIILIVVFVVFLALSIFAILLIQYLDSDHHLDHYFDVEPFQSAHPLYDEINLYYTVREKQRQKTPPISTDLDLYEFDVPMSDILNETPFKVADPNSKDEYYSIKKTALQRAVMLMEVTHNINYLGEFVFDHFNFYSSPRQKAIKLAQLLNQEKAYLNSKYQIDKYIHNQIGMCVFVPSYNNAKSRVYLRNLDSIFQQNYQNYHVVYVNDASTDGTGDYVKSYMEQNQIPTEKYTIINNEQKKLHCANIHMVGHNYCKEGEVMVLLDGDDSLIGREVFSLLNAVYQRQKVALTYGQFFVVKKNRVEGGWSRPIPKDYLENGAFRKLTTFFSSHLKTIYVDLFRKIKVADLQYRNGTFYNFSPDVAYMTPAIEMVGPRLAFINEVNYEYRYDTGSNEPHSKQADVTKDIYQKPAYKRLQSMPFADNPKTVHYDRV